MRSHFLSEQFYTATEENSRRASIAYDSNSLVVQADIVSPSRRMKMVAFERILKSLKLFWIVGNVENSNSGDDDVSVSNLN